MPTITISGIVRYASAPVGESPSPSGSAASSSTESEENHTADKIECSDIASVLSEKILSNFAREIKFERISYFVPTPSCRVDNPLIGGDCFCQVIEDGIGFPIHSFFCDVLDSYGIAPGNLTPLAWCHMAGMLMLRGDLY